MKTLLRLASTAFRYRSTGCGPCGSGQAPRCALHLRELPADTRQLGVEFLPPRALAEPSHRGACRYRWQYACGIWSLVEVIQVTHFACYSQSEAGWRLSTVTGGVYGADEFEHWWDCPEARIVPGRYYVNPRMSWVEAELSTSRGLWCFSGRTLGGVRVLAESTMLHVGRLSS